MPYRSLWLAAGLLASAGNVQAEPITFVFEGTVESVFDGLGVLDDSVAPGARFVGAYTFDSDTPNTAPPLDEGEPGLYHHNSPPAGVHVRIGNFTFRSVPSDPDFDIIVNNEVGFAGADEYGFVSRNNEALGLPPAPPVELLQLHWRASTVDELPDVNALDSAELPTTPPDLELLGGGLFTVYGECTPCLGPAAFFRIEGSLTSLELPFRLVVGPDYLSWTPASYPAVYDVVQGSVEILRTSGGDYASAIGLCLDHDLTETTLPFSQTPPFAEATWFLVRSVTTEGNGTYDSTGPAQAGSRNPGILASGHDCP